MAKKDRVKISHKTGLTPGTLMFVGEVKVEEMTASLIRYNQNETQTHNLEEKNISKIESSTSDVLWININGLHEIESIQEICQKWSVHQLIIEDIVNTNHRPKIEIYDDHIFVVTKMYFYQSVSKSISFEQVSFILTDNTVLSFQERPGDVFEPVRDRLKNNKGRIRKSGADYLLYSLLDCMVDSYFNLLEKIDEDLERSEKAMLSEPSSDALSNFFALKRSLLLLKKSAWPLREITSQLLKGKSELIKDSTEPYLRDLNEHTIHVIDSIETFRELASGLTDMYLSMTSNKMNEIMKVLTICASMFIPLTFIAGIYGMNFEYMPELQWKYSYFIIIGAMVAIIITMVVFFMKKKWF